MRHKIKLKFVDSIWGASIEETLVYKLLAEEYDIELSNDDPDYLIDGGLGEEHWKYNDCVKICFVGENVVPDFNAFDYAIGFDYLSFEDRYIRIPLYAFYDCYTDVVEKRRKYSDEQLLKRDFCSFVVPNNSWASPKREYFFHELSKYKRVDSGGRHLNNIGEPGGGKE